MTCPDVWCLVQITEGRSRVPRLRENTSLSAIIDVRRGRKRRVAIKYAHSDRAWDAELQDDFSDKVARNVYGLLENWRVWTVKPGRMTLSLEI